MIASACYPLPGGPIPVHDRQSLFWPSSNLPAGARRPDRIAPLHRETRLLGLYSRIICNFSIRAFPRSNCSFRWRTKEAAFSARFAKGTVDPPPSVCQAAHDVFLRECTARALFRQNLQRTPLRKARLAKSISQRARSSAPDHETLEFSSHGFHIFHFLGAALTSPKS